MQINFKNQSMNQKATVTQYAFTRQIIEKTVEQLEKTPEIYFSRQTSKNN